MGSVSLRFIVLPVDSLGRMHRWGLSPCSLGGGVGMGLSAACQTCKQQQCWEEQQA